MAYKSTLVLLIAIQYTAIPYMARTGFSLCTNSHREKPVLFSADAAVIKKSY
jgi:hypothetical protein